VHLNEVLDFLNKFARENTFFSIIILAIAGNIITDLFKKLMFFLATSTKLLARKTGKGISKWNKNNLELLLKKYREDIVKVEMIKNNEQLMYNELIHDLYYCLTLFFTMIILYLIVLKLDNPLFFYGLLGASARSLFSIFSITYYNNSLFENARNFEKYKKKKENRIKLIENILNK
jgi:hypothetical protein